MILDKETYVEKAEKVIKELSKNVDKRGNTKWITTSQIRNLLAMSADIYNDVVVSSEKLSPELTSRIDYLRVRCVYEAGRTPVVKDFIEKAQILNILAEVKGSRENFILFNHYMEALVAYHRFNKGKDN